MEPNIFITLTDALDTIPINPTFRAQLIGNSSGKTINVESDGTNQASALGVDAGTTVQFSGNSDDFTFVRNGTTVEVTDADGNIVASVAGGADAGTLKFADGSTTVTVDAVRSWPTTATAWTAAPPT